MSEIKMNFSTHYSNYLNLIDAELNLDIKAPKWVIEIMEKYILNAISEIGNQKERKL